MKRVTGIGGIFFKCANPAATAEWYKRHLGIETTDWGGWISRWEGDGCTIWTPFENSSDHFKSELMINYRVADLKALLDVLRSEGVTIVKEMEEHPQGKFGWIEDCDGRKVELWEPDVAATS